jgi:hypothetical protein
MDETKGSAVLQGEHRSQYGDSTPVEAITNLNRAERLNEKAKRLGKPDWLARRIYDFQKACDLGENVFWERGEAYGDATAECGLLGAAITLTTDVARIRRLLLDVEHLQKIVAGDAELTEKLRDALIDAHNYAAIALHWLDDGNIMGRPNYE